jgi:hypothetical protein
MIRLGRAMRVDRRNALTAAAFFTTYETLKQQLPELSSHFASSPALTHMTAASGGELVMASVPCFFSLRR